MTQPRQSGQNNLSVHTDYWKAIGNACNKAVYLISAKDGAIIDLNSRGVELLGYPSRKAALHTLITTQPDLQDRLPRAIEQMRTHGPQIFDWTGTRADGTLLPIEATLIWKSSMARKR